MRASWARVPLLLLLTVLASASAVLDSRSGPLTSLALATERADGSGLAGSIKPTHGPPQTALLSGVEHGSTSGTYRLSGDGEPTVEVQGPKNRPTRKPAAVASLRLLVSARARLEFGHEAAMARSGAYSAFGTSLPPPLLT